MIPGIRIPDFLRNVPAILAIAIFASLALWSCRLTQEGQAENTLSFTAMYDSLKAYDSVTIVVKDGSNGFPDTIFKGKVDGIDELRNLPADHYSGKDADIAISGFNSGKLAFEVVKKYDGTSRSTVSEQTKVSPHTVLTSDNSTLSAKAGDSADLPEVTVSPAGLAEKTLDWASSNPLVCVILGRRYFAIGAGEADLTATLKSDPGKSLVIHITVSPKVVVPPDTNPLPSVPPAAPAISSLIPADAKVSVTWSAVSDAKEYNLYYGEGNSVDKGSTRVKNVVSPYEVKALKNGTAYAFALTSVNPGGESELGASRSSTPQPIAVNVPRIDSGWGGNGSITLAWPAFPEALGYVVYYKAGNSVDKSGTRITGAASPYVLSGLANGTQYAIAITALKSDGETGLSNMISATPQAPPLGSLAYTSADAVYWKSLAIPANKAVVTGSVDSFTVLPPLPSGLSLDRKTGEITGAPASAQAKTGHTVKAWSAAGPASAAITVTVHGEPTGLSYKDNPAAYWQSVAIAVNPAAVSGIVDSFTVSPPLPAGIVLSKTTGAISGTPATIAIASEYTVTARNPAGAATAELTLSVSGPPSGFYYSVNPAVYAQGGPIAANTATISGAVDSFTVSPALPAGLSLDKSTGAITGTPLAASASASYTITARNAAGSPTVALSLSVFGPPMGLAYAFPASAYWLGVAVSPNTATVSGIVDSFTVTPALPAGLSLNKSTGALSGTPGAAIAAANYTVTARNGAGTSVKAISISVTGPPASLAYATNPAAYPKSVAIAANVATVSGPVDSFTVAPALPAGLSLNKATGAVTGTPTTPADPAIFAVTAWNPAGIVKTNLSIAVTSPLSGLSYSANPATYWKSVTIAPNTPSITGTPDSFTVLPAMPPGLALNKATGVITGAPNSPAAQTTYRITAKTGSASVAADLVITINGPPVILNYATHVSTYWKSVAIAAETPTVSGIVDEYSVSPALPAGLSISQSTGVISGTPTAAAANANYTVTAKNQAGISQATLAILVQNSPAIDYAVHRAAYTKDAAITANTVTATPAGTIDSFKVSPALPAGLSLGKTTGAISGTPTVAGASARYTITAWNKSGTGTDTVNITVSAPPSTLTLIAQRDISLDTNHASSFNNGYTGATFIGKPGQPYISIWKFDLSSASAAGFKSAIVRYRTYGYGPAWDGTAKTLTVKVYRVKSDWVEGTGNWNWYGGNWYNAGDLLYPNYPMSTTISTGSSDYHTAAGLKYTDHYIVRTENLILAETKTISANYTGASIHANFSTPFPAPANLVNLDIDMTEYVQGVLDGSYPDYGYTLSIEGLGTDGANWIGTMTKEAGDGNNDESDGNHGAKMILQY